MQQEGYPRGWVSTARIKIEDGKIVEITTNKMDIDGAGGATHTEKSVIDKDENIDIDGVGGATD